MSLEVETNLIGLLKKVTSNLNTVAKKEKVELSFFSDIKNEHYSHNKKEVYLQLSNLIKRIISFTPQFYKVMVILDKHKIKERCCILLIKNTGANLYRIRELTNGLNFNVEVKGIKKEGTIFRIEIPLDRFDKLETINAKKDRNNLGYTPYYKEIENKLSIYFRDIKNMQDAAEKRSPELGKFLHKVNTTVKVRMSDHRFKVDALAAAMALSRSQLFRKLKALTNLSPSQYLLYFRLLEARELLETKRNGYNVSEVCYRVGFVSKSHFTRSFHKQFGFPPSSCK